MRHILLPVLVLAVAGCQAGVAPLTDEDIAAVNAIRTSYAEGVLARDADALAALYAEDGLLWEPDAPAVAGRDAIRAAAVNPAATVEDYRVTSLELVGYGDLAVDRGTWTQTYRVEGMDESITLTGNYVGVARRQADGSWLLTLLIYNTDAPIPRPPEPQQ